MSRRTSVPSLLSLQSRHNGEFFPFDKSLTGTGDDSPRPQAKAESYDQARGPAESDRDQLTHLNPRGDVTSPSLGLVPLS